ncbi:MAG: tRNA uridine-5-carboxymethylaminomethyl(34) synthesis GTPase MnmE [Bacteroidetes bacterium]|nr:tRNA uridine-5-carboxymethylaminomethyl(34) synthesis GTPase MnmE [Bacteroidota bacterium]
MYHLTNNDTICAISTPPGLGAISVIRLSGPAAISTCKKIFLPREKELDLEQVASHTIHFGTIGDPDGILDEVLLSVFRAPHSYTGEDVIEISCHGSPYIQQKLIGLLLEHGLRLANPGEFTLRAFLNKKFDLSQAEAVADLIASHSKSSHDLALSQMRGGFSKKIKSLREKLVDFTSLIELELDFSEENVEFASRPELVKLLVELEDEIDLLIKSFTIGNVIKNGIPVTIIGKPNVGKSTLLNTILNEEKAIVSEIPGTTRDAIEDTIGIGEYRFRFIDTAGLRSSDEPIEMMGIERTWEKIHEASIILYVFDATEDSYSDVMQAVSEFKELAEDKTKKLILIGNKTDKLDKLPSGFRDFVEVETIFASAKRKENIHLIADSLVASVKAENLSGSPIVSNIRHLQALQNALATLKRVHNGLDSNLSPELLTSDLRNALHHLGEITGDITSEEILGNIFGRFCIGK